MIKKLRYSNCWDAEITEAFNEMADAMNAIQTKEVSAPKPKPELRDGDVCDYGDSVILMSVIKNYKGKTDRYTNTTEEGLMQFNRGYRKPLCNILDLAAAVKRGELIVTLTKE